jgi:hypothetical protein
MPREQLLGLAADVDRLLGAGAAAAVGHDTFTRRARTLRDLGQKVPALLPVADAVDKLTGAAPKQVAPAFLDLVLTARQVRASLAATGVPGELKPLPESGPWHSRLPVRDLRPLLDALAGETSDREGTLRGAAIDGNLADLRLIPALAGAVEDGNADVADLIADEILSPLGRGVVPELESGLSFKGGVGTVRRLRLICRLDAETGARLCRMALAEGTPALRAAALEFLAGLVPAEEAERLGLEHLADKNADVRVAALGAVGRGSSDRALETLLGCQAERADDVRRAAAEALGAVAHSGATDQVLCQLNEALTALAARPAPTKPKPEKTKAKGKGKVKGKGKKAKEPEKPPKVDAERARLLRRVSWLALALGGRSDRPHDVAAALLPLARHRDQEVRAFALEALGGIATGRVEARQTLREALDDKVPLREPALRGLARLPAAERAEAAPRILELARDPRAPWPLRKAAFAALRGLQDRHGPEIAEALGKVLRGTGYASYRAGIEMLEDLGPEMTRSLMPELVPHLIESRMAYYFSQHLARLDPEGHGAARLIELFEKRPRNNVPPVYFLALQSYGPRAAAAVPALQDLLERSKSTYGQAMVRNTLRRIGH